MHWHTTADDKYRVESLTPATFPCALKVIQDCFCQEESVSIGSEINKNPKAAEELLELCADAALDGVSLVVVAVDTDEVVAVAFNKIQTKSSDDTEKTFFEIFAEERCKQDSSKSLIQFMANVDGRCNLFDKYGVDCSLELMFLATRREHRQKSLGRILCEFSIQVGKKFKDGAVVPITVDELGPKYSIMKPRNPLTTYPKISQVIWTSIPSQKIGKALGFTVHLTVPLSEFIFDGKSYSERIGDPSAYCEVAATIL